MIPFPNKKYNIIYADPPWSYNDKGCRGAAEAKYPTMTVDELKALPVMDIADNNCMLFMWATYPNLAGALEVIKSWGFQYKTVAFQWIKLNKSGKGYFFGIGH